MERLQKLPIGIQNFDKLRSENFLYVDKTEKIYKLINDGTYFFLSRPRRFGKSLLISTLRAFFEGKKELFDGLYIAEKETDWNAYPVLHLDLNTNRYDTPNVLVQKLDDSLSIWEELYATPRKDLPLGMRFEKVIEGAYKKTGLRAVILVDEYDKPMLQAIGKPELLDEYRAILKGFYGALKSMDGSIQFALLTGVTKFSKISVFSDLNNLRDISMQNKYSDICGISEKELLDYFSYWIEELAQANQMTREECLDMLRTRYDGYHFHQEAVGVYNPFSVLNTFANNEFGSYWFSTGTPTFLAELLRTRDCNLEEMAHCVTSAKILDSVDDRNSNPIPVIYQSGYLTIKGYDKEFGLYKLGFPNKEVEEGFLDYLLPYYTPINQCDTAFNIREFVMDVRQGKTDKFLKRLKSLFADTPYELVKDLENHYQNVVWLLCKLMGFYVKAEYHTSYGRIDIVLQTPKFCYVIEFKLDGTAEEALLQIKEKSYTLPFEMNGQKIVRIGINFSKETRNIEKCLVEE